MSLTTPVSDALGNKRFGNNIGSESSVAILLRLNISESVLAAVGGGGGSYSGWGGGGKTGSSSAGWVCGSKPSSLT